MTVDSRFAADGNPSSANRGGGGGDTPPPWLGFTSSDFSFRGDYDGAGSNLSWVSNRYELDFNRPSSRTWWSRSYMQLGPAPTAFDADLITGRKVLQVRMSEFEFTGGDALVSPYIGVGFGVAGGSSYGDWLTNRGVGVAKRWLAGSPNTERLIAWNNQQFVDEGNYGSEPHAADTIDQIIATFWFAPRNANVIVEAVSLDSDGDVLERKLSWGTRPASESATNMTAMMGNASSGAAGDMHLGVTMDHRIMPFSRLYV